MRAVVVLVAAGLLAGCTTQFDLAGRAWTKPGAQLPQVTLDEMECARVAVDARPFPDTLIGGIPDLVAAKIQDVKMSRDFDHCMSARGYQPARG